MMVDPGNDTQIDAPWSSHQASLESCIQKEVSKIAKSLVGHLWSNHRTHPPSPTRLAQFAGNNEESRIL